MAKKTETLYGSAILDGGALVKAIASFTTALENLELMAGESQRTVLYDTLEVSIERDIVDNRSILDNSGVAETIATIEVRASAVQW